jgi:hypothetical protein
VVAEHICKPSYITESLVFGLFITPADALLLLPVCVELRLSHRITINQSNKAYVVGAVVVLLVDRAVKLPDFFKEEVQCLLDAVVKGAILSMLPSRRNF